MSLHNVILDNRIHRTIRISTDQQEFNLVPASDYKVLLKVLDGKDTLVVSKDGQPVASIACTNTYTPPASGTTIDAIKNNSCQFSMDVDDTVYRIVEVDQFICDPTKAKVWFTTASNNNATNHAITNTLVYEGENIAMSVPADGKVPPQLG